VPLPPPPSFAPQLQERFHDVMGEQTLRILFEEWLPAGTAAEAASDWGGDRMAVFSDDARQRWAVGWHIRFDSAAAAERAFVALARSLPLTDRGHEERAVPDSAVSAKRLGDKVCRPRHSQGPIAAVRHDRDLGVTLGPFERNSPGVVIDLVCASTLGWARQIANN
jgi:hypothetical protein